MADYAEDTLNKFGKPVSDFTSSIQPRRTALNTAAKNESTDYLTRFRQAIMGQEALPHMMTRIGDELNLPNLATNFNQVSNQMTNLPGTYSKASRGFDVNANQLDRIVSTKQAALAPALTTATQNYQTAQDQRNQMIAATQAEQEKQLQPFATEKEFLADRWARESTGFSQDNQTELSGLIDKMKAGITLSEGEKTRANELAKAELSYKAAIETANISANASRDVANINAKSRSNDPLGLFS